MIDRACLSLNAKCNLNCSYCHFAKKKNNKHSKANEFSNEEVTIICRNLEEYIINNDVKNFKLGIVGSGEPLLSFNQLKTVVEFFKSSVVKGRVKMYTITNGTLLNEEIVEFFHNNQDIIELNVSLDGDKEVSMNLRGYFPDFSCCEAVFGQKPKINSVVTKTIIDNRDRIFSFFKENGFNNINFSKVFATTDPEVAISDADYRSFLAKASDLGIVSRQNSACKKYDCAKYGKLCGVGRTNIFITRTGIYPCGRFMNHKEYMLGSWNSKILEIEKTLKQYTACPDGHCYFEYNKVGTR